MNHACSDAAGVIGSFNRAVCAQHEVTQIVDKFVTNSGKSARSPLLAGAGTDR